MKNPNVVVSARGEMVDFELMRLKQEISTTPAVATREPRRGRRKRLSDRVAKVQTTTQAPEEIPAQDEPAEIVEPVPTIVRRKRG